MHSFVARIVFGRFFIHSKCSILNDLDRILYFSKRSPPIWFDDKVEQNITSEFPPCLFYPCSRTFQQLQSLPATCFQALEDHGAEARSHDSELAGHVRGRCSKMTHVRDETRGMRQTLGMYAKAITCVLAYSGQHRDKSGRMLTESLGDVESRQHLHKAHPVMEIAISLTQTFSTNPATNNELSTTASSTWHSLRSVPSEGDSTSCLLFSVTLCST